LVGRVISIAAQRELRVTAARADRDHAMREHAAAVPAHDDVAANHVDCRDRRGGDDLTVANRGVHAAALGAEANPRPAGERLFHHLGEQSRVAHRARVYRTDRSSKAFALRMWTRSAKALAERSGPRPPT